MVSVNYVLAEYIEPTDKCTPYLFYTLASPHPVPYTYNSLTSLQVPWFRIIETVDSNICIELARVTCLHNRGGMIVNAPNLWPSGFRFDSVDNNICIVI